MVDTKLREFLVRKLSENKMRVVFTKANEERREMICTLDPKIVPPPVSNAEGRRREKAFNEDALAVWDIDKEGWRSFRLDSLISYDVIEEAA